jgi:hypothetical protein
MYNPLEHFDAFEEVSNESLIEVYWEAARNKDIDLKLLETEMIKRGLLGRC